MEYYQLGVNGYQCQDYTTAIPAFSKYLERMPNSKNGLIYRGLCYAAVKKYELAQQDYSRAIQIGDGKDALACYNRGVVYSLTNQFQKAIKDYSRCIALGGINQQVYHNRAQTYKTLKLYNQSLQDFNQVLTINPKNIHALNDRGNIYSQFGRYNQALSDFDAVIKIDPDYGHAFNNRGVVYLQMKDYCQAEANYQSVLELMPDDLVALFNLAYCYHKNNKIDKAQEIYQHAIDIFDHKTEKELMEIFQDQKEHLELIKRTLEQYRQRKRQINAMNRVSVESKRKDIQDGLKELTMLNMHRAISMTDRIHRHRALLQQTEGENGKLHDRLEQMEKELNKRQNNHRSSPTSSGLNQKTKVPLNDPNPERQKKKGKENKIGCGCAGKNDCEIY